MSEEIVFPKYYGPDVGEIAPVEGGLTKRELFAAMIAQGIVGAHWWRPSSSDDSAMIANQAVATADSLLAALAQPAEPK